MQRCFTKPKPISRNLTRPLLGLNQEPESCWEAQSSLFASLALASTSVWHLCSSSAVSLLRLWPDHEADENDSPRHSCSPVTAPATLRVSVPIPNSQTGDFMSPARSNPDQPGGGAVCLHWAPRNALGRAAGRDALRCPRRLPRGVCFCLDHYLMNKRVYSKPAQSWVPLRLPQGMCGLPHLVWDASLRTGKGTQNLSWGLGGDNEGK